MKQQPPLLDQTGASLPGPQFTPRPGWGGQFRHWCSHHAYTLVFRLVILCAIILVGRSVWVNLPARDSSLVPSPAASLQEAGGIMIQAEHGDGMTNLAARAVDLYVTTRSSEERLDAAQYLYAVDTLARLVCWCPLEVDQEVTFAVANIRSVIDRALALTPTQHRAWTHLLR